jgi:hypothetical protein
LCPTPTPAATPTAGPTSSPNGPSIDLSTHHTTSGGHVEVTGTGFMPDTDVTVTLDDNPTELCTGHTDENGTFTCEIVLGAGAQPGTHEVVATGLDPQGNAAEPQSPITLNVPATPPSTSQLADPAPDGGDGLVVALALALLLAAATWSLARTRARRRS